MTILNVMKRLQIEKKISPPSFLIDNISYATLMGSTVYGASSDQSDMDIYGFVIPPLSILFPVLEGEIPGFGNQKKRFNIYAEAHIQDGDKEYDFNIYNIVDYMQLAMNNNPNILDSLFVDDKHILYKDNISSYIKDNRHIFLHKGAYHKFTGYAHSQMNKIHNGNNSNNPKRKLTIEKYGFDVKFGYQVVRLLLQLEQILSEGDMDLSRNSQILMDIRTGKWTLNELEKWKLDKEKELESLYESSELRHSYNEKEVYEVLRNALEMKYGTLSFLG